MLRRLAPLALLAPVPAAGVVHVDTSAPLGGDGASWATAYTHLQDGLAAAVPGDVVWVAAGTYAPDLGASWSPGDRNATFVLASGVAVYGGFAGTETSLAQRAGLFDQTILTGDLLGDDLTFGSSDNSLHVVSGSNVDASAVLDGFAIVAGYGDGGNATGAGMELASAHPTLANLTFIANVTAARGGALYAPSSSPTLTDCAFRLNGVTKPTSGGFVYGGAVYLSSSSAVFRRCTFEDNWCENTSGGGFTWGGAAYVTGGAVRFEDCVFEGNRSEVLGGGGFGEGGAVFDTGAAQTLYVRCRFEDNLCRSTAFGFGGAVNVEGTAARFDACTFLGNRAEGIGRGGALYVERDANVVVAQCVFSGNSATWDGAGLYVTHDDPVVSVHHSTFAGNVGGSGPGGVDVSSSLNVALYGCVLWDNGGAAEADQLDGPLAAVDHSLVQGWTGLLPGVGTIAADPLFVDALGPDGTAGTADDDLRLADGSPARDAGNAAGLPSDAADLDGDGIVVEPLPVDALGFPRLVDDPLAPDTGPGAAPHVDLGAFEAQAATFYADVPGVSLSAGGAQTMFLDPGATFAGRPYLVMGSVAGSAPGFLADGHLVPLDPVDPYWVFTVTTPNQPPLANSFGVLDGNGQGTCTLTVPPGSNPAFAGIVSFHAYVVFQTSPAPLVVFASEALPVTLLP